MTDCTALGIHLVFFPTYVHQFTIFSYNSLPCIPVWDICIEISSSFLFILFSLIISALRLQLWLFMKANEVTETANHECIMYAYEIYTGTSPVYQYLYTDTSQVNFLYMLPALCKETA